MPGSAVAFKNSSIRGSCFDRFGPASIQLFIFSLPAAAANRDVRQPFVSVQIRVTGRVASRWFAVHNETGRRRRVDVRVYVGETDCVHAILVVLAFLAERLVVFRFRNVHLLQTVHHGSSQHVRWLTVRFAVNIVVLLDHALDHVLEVVRFHVVRQQMQNEEVANGGGEFFEVLLLGGWSQLSELVVANAREQNQNHALQQAQRGDAEEEGIPEPEHNVDLFVDDVHCGIWKRGGFSNGFCEIRKREKVEQSTYKAGSREHRGVQWHQSNRTCGTDIWSFWGTL